MLFFVSLSLNLLKTRQITADSGFYCLRIPMLAIQQSSRCHLIILFFSEIIHDNGFPPLERDDRINGEFPENFIWAVATSSYQVRYITYSPLYSLLFNSSDTIFYKSSRNFECYTAATNRNSITSIIYFIKFSCLVLLLRSLLSYYNYLPQHRIC